MRNGRRNTVIGFAKAKKKLFDYFRGINKNYSVSPKQTVSPVVVGDFTDNRTLLCANTMTNSRVRFLLSPPGGRYVRADGFPTYVDDDGSRKDRTRPTSCPAPVDRPNQSHPRKHVHERRTRSGPIFAGERPPKDVWFGLCSAQTVHLEKTQLSSPKKSTTDFGKINACAQKTFYCYFMWS